MSIPFTTMRKTLITEILFFLTAIVTSLITFHFAFGFTSIETESVLDINVHDTYFVIEKRELFPLFSLLILYLFYFIKVCVQKFKNRQTLWIFSIISLTTILICPSILGFVKSLATEPGWTVYPPLSATKVEIKENMFSRIYPNLYFAYIALTMFGVFVFYKLGKLYKRHSS
jgi:heme/copper-type cytochrome/quinol oxidase subunit 1